MKRRLMIEVDAGEKTCDGCDRCNIDCDPAECLVFSVAAGEDLGCVPLVFSARNGGGWKRCRKCLAAEQYDATEEEVERAARMIAEHVFAYETRPGEWRSVRWDDLVIDQKRRAKESARAVLAECRRGR